MEENMTVEFNKVFITTQSTAKWELQQRKDVLNTKNLQKKTAHSKPVATQVRWYATKGHLRTANGDYKPIAWGPYGQTNPPQECQILCSKN